MFQRIASLVSATGLLGVVLASAFALGLACSSDDDQLGTENPEIPPPPPAVSIDAGVSGDAGDQRGCPSSPPRVGETCPRTDVVDQTCSYNLGSCTIDGMPYDNVEEYRCYQGTWHMWNADTNKCRMP
jgi:hypothetical protein